MGGAVPSSDVQRKLTAILFADVVGHSRLMAADEVATWFFRGTNFRDQAANIPAHSMDCPNSIRPGKVNFK